MVADHAWYKDGATVVAAVALGVSLVSSVISSWYTKNKDKDTAHLDLRTVLQRLLQLPKESMDLRDKYKDREANERDSLVAMGDNLLWMEKTFLTSQGAVLARKLGPKLVSAPEYLTLSRAQGDVFNITAQHEFIDHACQTANTANDTITALQEAGGFQFARGNFDEGRASLKKALQVFDTYKGYDGGTVAVTYARSHLYWAQLERGHGHFTETNQQLEQAVEVMANAPVTPNGEIVKQQIAGFWSGGTTGGPAVTNPVQAPVAAATIPGANV
jgi:tetratricopeptide (TPR) repeat protein